MDKFVVMEKEKQILRKVLHTGSGGSCKVGILQDDGR